MTADDRASDFCFEGRRERSVQVALLTCADCVMSRPMMVSSVDVRFQGGCAGGCVCALRGRGVSADAQAYFGTRPGLATGSET